MRTIPTDLYNEIQEGNICNIVKITLQDGTVYGYTDFDEAITVDAVEFIPAPGLQKVKMTLTASSEVSNQELAHAWVDAPEEDLKAGKFDSAEIIVGWASWKHPEFGIFSVFTGLLGELTWSDAGVKADIFSAMKALEQNIGEQFTANCRHVLFSQDGPSTIGACRVNPGGFSTTGTISSVTTPRWKFSTTISDSTSRYANGKLTFTSGPNTGIPYIVKIQNTGNITLLLPTKFPVAAGETFTILAGCDRTLATCKAKFDNVINFGGFPHIQPDVSFR